MPRQSLEDAINLLGLSASANLDVSKLDNGTRQKVSVAREVARQPQFILFDEPITNVDAASKLQLKRSLKELTRSLSQTIVYVTHDLEFAASRSGMAKVWVRGYNGGGWDWRDRNGSNAHG